MKPVLGWAGACLAAAGLRAGEPVGAIVPPSPPPPASSTGTTVVVPAPAVVLPAAPLPATTPLPSAFAPLPTGGAGLQYGSAGFGSTGFGNPGGPLALPSARPLGERPQITPAEQEAADLVVRQAVRAVRLWPTLDGGQAEVLFARRQGDVLHMHARLGYTRRDYLGRATRHTGTVFFSMIHTPNRRAVVNADYVDDNGFPKWAINVVRIIPAVNAAMARVDKVYGPTRP